MTTVNITNTDRLVNFGDCFRELAELVLDATRYGTSPFAEDQYLRLRSWLLMNYKGVREQIRPVMPHEANAKSNMGWPGSDLDSFEQLMSCSTLDQVTRQPERILTMRLKAISAALERAVGGAVPA